MRDLARLVQPLVVSILLVACSQGEGTSVDPTSASGETNPPGQTGGGGSSSGSQSAGTGSPPGSSSSGGSGGAPGTGGQGGGGATDGGTTPPPGNSNLPVPPGASDVPKPSGSAANLKVLPWAGFKSAVTYTFDDAQPSQIDHWAEIKATGIRSSFYLTTGSTSYASFEATWKDVLATGNELGNHTVHHCHPDLTGCTTGTALPSIGAEIDQCDDYIKNKLGLSTVLTIAYPFGDTGYATASKSRFFLGRGVNGGTVGPGDNTDPFQLPIVMANGGEAASKFNGDVDTARSQGKWVIFLFHSLLPGQNWYAGVNITTVTGNIAHAKSLPDVWIDTMASVGAYWLGQKTVQGVTPSSSGGSTTWKWTLPAHFPPGKYLRVKVDGGTLKQGDTTLAWDPHGYYEVGLDAGSLTWSP